MTRASSLTRGLTNPVTRPMTARSAGLTLSAGAGARTVAIPAGTRQIQFDGTIGAGNDFYMNIIRPSDSADATTSSMLILGDVAENIGIPSDATAISLLADSGSFAVTYTTSTTALAYGDDKELAYVGIGSSTRNVVDSIKAGLSIPYTFLCLYKTDTPSATGTVFGMQLSSDLTYYAHVGPFTGHKDIIWLSSGATATTKQTDADVRTADTWAWSVCEVVGADDMDEYIDTTKVIDAWDGSTRSFVTTYDQMSAIANPANTGQPLRATDSYQVGALVNRLLTADERTALAANENLFKLFGDDLLGVFYGYFNPLTGKDGTVGAGGKLATTTAQALEWPSFLDTTNTQKISVADNPTWTTFTLGGGHGSFRALAPFTGDYSPDGGTTTVAVTADTPITISGGVNNTTAAFRPDATGGLVCVTPCEAE